MEKLTKQEEEVMMLFWQLGKSCYIRDVMDIYPEPKPPYTSVRQIQESFHARLGERLLPRLLPSDGIVLRQRASHIC